MSPFAHIPVVFAGRGDTFRDLGGGFRGDNARVHTSEILIVVVAAVIAIIIFWLLAHWASWREGRGVYNNPKQLFRRLAAAHSLSLRERWLLIQASRHVQIPFAACLFLRPDLFDTAAAHSELTDRGEELRAMKTKLFGL
jgi:hypothetical protein